MDNNDHPLKRKPINEIMIILKDIRSDISQIKRDMVMIKNQVKKSNENGNDIATSSGGWYIFS